MLQRRPSSAGPVVPGRYEVGLQGRVHSAIVLLRVAALACLAASCATAPAAPPHSAEQLDALRAHAVPITGRPQDYDALLEMIGDHQFVLLGESTHGTREFYSERARLTRRLIEEKGFTLVVLEADWPDAYDLNEFIHGGGPATATEALRTFTRFPKWMWNNGEVRELVDWLRAYNRRAPTVSPVGLYGMDLYSVTESMNEVVEFLRTADPAAAGRAESRYKCLRRYREDTVSEYAADAVLRGRSCEAGVVAQFQELTERVARAGSGHQPGDDQLVSAWQNSRVVANAEAYYRTGYAGGVASWNLRDRHMADTIDAVSGHLNAGASRPAKAIVWAHNSHLGDARVTARADLGELNVGQLMRQRHDGQAVLIGFTTYTGTVRAAAAWGSGGRVRELRPALRESFSGLFHELGLPAFSLLLRGRDIRTLSPPRPERFVGVIYSPASERESHYYQTDLARQYDAVVHLDQTSAVDEGR